MEKQIKTIEEFLKEMFDIQSKVEKEYNCWNANYYTDMAFRGQSNKDYELLPAIGRDRRSCCHISILDQERNLIEMAKYKLPHIFNSSLLPIDLLALLQHYGIPTRLLDVTSNPLVALYFASFDDSVDGEVLIFIYNGSVLGRRALSYFIRSRKARKMICSPYGRQWKYPKTII